MFKSIIINYKIWRLKNKLYDLDVVGMSGDMPFKQYTQEYLRLSAILDELIRKRNIMNY